MKIGRSFDAITRGFGYFDYDKTRYFANVVTLDKDGNIFDKLDTNLPTRSWNYGANTTLGGVLNNFADFGE